MRALRLSPKAQSDLDAIWNYTTQNWNERQAETYLTSLEQAMQLLCINPLMGVDISYIREGYRKFSVASHLLIYVVRTDSLDVMRILHKSMDVDRHV
jgi:toxin ParE1/3/4